MKSPRQGMDGLAASGLTDEVSPVEARPDGVALGSGRHDEVGSGPVGGIWTVRIRCGRQGRARTVRVVRRARRCRRGGVSIWSGPEGRARSGGAGTNLRHGRAPDGLVRCGSAERGSADDHEKRNGMVRPGRVSRDLADMARCGEVWRALSGGVRPGRADDDEERKRHGVARLRMADTKWHGRVRAVGYVRSGQADLVRHEWKAGMGETRHGRSDMEVNAWSGWADTAGQR